MGEGGNKVKKSAQNHFYAEIIKFDLILTNLKFLFFGGWGKKILLGKIAPPPRATTEV